MVHSVIEDEGSIKTHNGPSFPTSELIPTTAGSPTVTSPQNEAEGTPTNSIVTNVDGTTATTPATDAGTPNSSPCTAVSLKHDPPDIPTAHFFCIECAAVFERRCDLK
jgi:hypothetical protein